MLVLEMLQPIRNGHATMTSFTCMGGWMCVFVCWSGWSLSHAALGASVAQDYVAQVGVVPGKLVL